MKKIFLVFTVLFWVMCTAINAADDKFVVVIDAGHGGKDGGAVRGTYKEKEINLGVALALGKLIESNMPDVKVVYTRKTDVFVDLYKRADIANKAKANLFISIHTNSTAAKVTTASGADTYILGLAKSEENLAVAKRENSVILLEDNYTKRYEGFDPNSPESNIIFEFMTDKYMEQSLQFASNVQSGFTGVARRVDRGVLQAGFLVLRESGMPSVLIELGFINNPTEAKYLTSSTGQRNMASAIFSGLQKYKKEFDKKQGKSYAGTSRVTKKESARANDIILIEDSNEDDNDNTSSQDTNKSTPSTSSNRPKYISKNTDVTQLTNTNSRDRKPAVKQEQTRKTESVSSSNPVAPSKETKTSSNVNNNTKSVVSSGTIEYRVQFLTGGSKFASNSPKFKGLSPVGFYMDGSIYKYTYGSATTEAEALRLQKEVRTKFKDAFIVRFKNNVRIK